MIGANRLGKTDWLTADNALFAEGRHPIARTPRNARLWITVLKNDMVDKVLLPKFKEKLWGNRSRWEYNDNKKTIYVKIGANNWSSIEIKSQEAGRGSFEGATVHRLSFDEQPEEPIFDSALVRVIDTGGQVLMAATMWEEGISWVFDRFIQPFIDGKTKDVEFVDGAMEDNAVLSKAQIDEFFRALSLKNPEEALVRVKGARIPLSGKCIFNVGALMGFREKMAGNSYQEAEFQYA
jgi:phage terminase large subunit-like protein